MEIDLPDTEAFYSARAYFPRGLFQPEGSFRFSADALLLAAFTVRRCLPEAGPASLLDLGCGCGVAGLACLLARKELIATGIDIDPDLTSAARSNAASLGLEKHFEAKALDLASNNAFQHISPAAFDAVAANIPFRSPNAGHTPSNASRRRALFADEYTLPAFLGSSKHALAEGGRLALIYPLSGMDTLLQALARYDFSPLVLLPVIAARKESARVLVAAGHRLNSDSAPQPEPPLYLYSSPGNLYTKDALAFCPWLAR